MNRKTWFGTRGSEAWIPTPSINPEYARSGFASRADYIGGGAGVRESKNAHNIYGLSWGLRSSEDVRLITDFADGVFDTKDGVNLVDWHDPMTTRTNSLNQAWATPSLACEDANPLIVNRYGRGRPTAVATPSNNARYPARSAQYIQQPDSITLEIYKAIPPGMNAHVGIHGDGAEGVFEVQRVDGYSEVGSAVVPALLGASDQRTNEQFSSVDSSGIVLRITPTATEREFILHGLIIQMRPIGESVPDGPFISGQGHAGCQFIGKPLKTPYSAVLDYVAVTARLEETGMDL